MLIPMSVLFVLLVLGDQLSKIAAVKSLVEIGASAKFIPGLIRFEYYRNTGMAWGLFQNASWVFVLVSLVLGGGIAYIMIKYRRTMPKAVFAAFTLILAGAVGNLIDRIALGYVRDFIMFEFIKFPVFNIADSCVTVGAVLLAVCLIFTRSGREFFGGDDAKKSVEKANAKVADAQITDITGAEPDVRTTGAAGRGMSAEPDADSSEPGGVTAKEDKRA